MSFTFVLYGYGAHPDLHSFPTRRSSDLEGAGDPGAVVVDRAVHRQAAGGGEGWEDAAGEVGLVGDDAGVEDGDDRRDRKSTRLNSSHLVISYAVFCLKKKNKLGSL